MSERAAGSDDHAWDPDTDETEWWADDRDEDDQLHRRRPRRLVTIVGLLTVAGFGAATVISSGESQAPVTTVPPTVPPTVAPVATEPSTTAVIEDQAPATLLDALPSSVSDLTVEGLSGRPELEIVALSADGTLHEIDFAGGTVRSTSTPGIDSAAPAYIFTRNDEISVIAYDNVAGFVLDRNREPRTLAADGSAGGLLFPGPFDDSTWQLDRQGAADVAAELIALDGQPIGPVVRRDVDTVLGSDGLGQLVVAATGGTYVVGTGLPTRLTTGDVLAIGVEHALVRECDDRLVCAVVVRSRSDDRAMTIEGATEAVLRAEAPATLGGLVSGTVSPDGGVVMVRSDERSGQWTATDLATGVVTILPGPTGLSPIVWTPDSHFAVFVAANGLFVFDREAGRTTMVESIPAVRSIAPTRSPRVAATSGSLYENGAVIDNGAVFSDVVLDG